MKHIINFLCSIGIHTRTDKRFHRQWEIHTCRDCQNEYKIFHMAGASEESDNDVWSLGGDKSK